ncbi:MAG: hypothetical protein H7210_12760 [Pyrinomonadaceae bacterium]|nr:hypothetical protein [Phycisphaerales bacterium]
MREPTLAAASPEYQRKTLQGLSLILNAILLTILLGVLSFVVVIASIVRMMAPGAGGAATFTGNQELMVALTLVTVGISCMSLLGYWRYSEPDPSETAFEPTNAARKVLRVLVLIELAIASLTAVLNFVTYSGTGAAPVAGAGLTAVGMVLVAARVASVVLYAIKFFAVMRYTRWLASRVPDTFIMDRTRTYMWLLPLLHTVGSMCVGLGPLIALVLYWNLLHRMRKHLKSIIATGERASLSGLDRPMPTSR